MNLTYRHKLLAFLPQKAANKYYLLTILIYLQLMFLLPTSKANSNFLFKKLRHLITF